jgi:hypothetical protein
MPPLLVLAFAAGVAVGANWPAIRTALGPLLETAGNKFDDLYAAVARAFGEQKEAVQDARAERQHRARASRTGPGPGARTADPGATLLKSQGRRPAKRARKRPARRPRQVSVPSTSVADR